MNSIPKLLYKYRSVNEYSLQILSDNKIYLSSPDKLNDPLDFRIPISYYSGTKNQLFNKGSENLRYTEPNLNRIERRKKARITANTVYKHRHDEKKKEKFIKDLYDSFNNSFGVFSLSALCDNNLMWSHYADSHRGFCIEFNTVELTRGSENFLMEGNVCYIAKVNYFKKLPTANPYDSSDFDIFKTIAYSKTIDWKYEEEYRIVSLNRTDIVVNIGKNIISKVILGVNCSSKDEKNIIKILTEREYIIPLMKINLQNENHNSEIIEIPY
jgi:hypothetical protein